MKQFEREREICTCINNLKTQLLHEQETLKSFRKEQNGVYFIIDDNYILSKYLEYDGGGQFTYTEYEGNHGRDERTVWVYISDVFKTREEAEEELKRLLDDKIEQLQKKRKSL